MIKIKKGTIPDMLKHTFQKGHEYVMEYLQNPQQITRPEFSVRGAGTLLYQEFNDKCAFCESKTKSVDALQYHHYRPTSNAADKEGTISKLHYTWLMYQWDNLFLVCNVCAKNKANKFPVLKANGRVNLNSSSPQESVFERTVLNEEEYPLIFDLCHYDPEEWFYFTRAGHMHLLPRKNEFGADRSSYTIQSLDLNRDSLVNARKTSLDSLHDLIDEAKHSYQLSAFEDEEYASKFNLILNGGKEEYCGALRFFTKMKVISDNTFSNWLIGKKVISKEDAKSWSDFYRRYYDFLGSQVAEESQTTFRAKSLGEIRIKKIVIKGFRAIDDLMIQFPDKPSGEPARENWLALIGENGSGKSTILQAIYACLTIDDYGFSKDDFAPDGYINIITEGDTFSVKISDELGDLIWWRKVHQTPVLGYGAIRISESESEFEKSKIDTSQIFGSNLVNPIKPLLNTGNWIMDRLKKGDFEKNTVKESLLKLVEKDNRYDLSMVEGKVRIISNVDKEYGEDYDFLSTGYRQMLTLACDIMKTLNLSYDAIESARGIVLIDEIENHLHPKWKTQIVSQLRELFPLVQFIITTHDPLCLNGLEEGEVVLLQRNDENQIKAFDGLPSPSLLSSEQLLTSPLFGMASTYSTKVQDDFIRMELLKIKRDRSNEEDAELNQLKSTLEGELLHGDTFRESLLLDAIDSVLADQRSHVKFDQAEVRKEVKSEALRMLEKYFK